MEALPPELKAHICSYLDPVDLKVIRLCSTSFSAAACRFIQRRVYLFDQKESYQDALALLDDPVFPQSVTTLIIDVSHLEACSDYDSWLWLLSMRVPRWSEYRPRENRHPRAAKAAVIRDRLESAEKAYKKEMAKFSYTQEELQGWFKIHQDIVAYQAEDPSGNAMLHTISRLFLHCPRLSNIVVTRSFSLEPHERIKLCMRQLKSFGTAAPLASICGYTTLPDSKITLHQIFECLPPSIRSLRSLIIQNVDMPQSTDSGDPDMLKHLRHLQLSRPTSSMHKYLSPMLEAAQSIETLKIHDTHSRENTILNSFNSRCLRSVKMFILGATKDELDDFISRYAHTLQWLWCVRIWSYSNAFWRGWNPLNRRVHREQFSDLKHFRGDTFNSRALNLGGPGSALQDCSIHRDDESMALAEMITESHWEDHGL